MAQQMKYVVFDSLHHDGQLKHDVPFIFPDHLIHAEVAKLLGRGGLVESAGFCTLEKLNAKPRKGEKDIPYDIADKDKEIGVRWICWGESESLRIKSKPDEDQRILDKWYR